MSNGFEQRNCLSCACIQNRGAFDIPSTRVECGTRPAYIRRSLAFDNSINNHSFLAIYAVIDSSKQLPDFSNSPWNFGQFFGLKST